MKILSVIVFAGTSMAYRDDGALAGGTVIVSFDWGSSKYPTFFLVFLYGAEVRGFSYRSVLVHKRSL
jgi:hypothetical protein